jgi:hypothetical protein
VISTESSVAVREIVTLPEHGVIIPREDPEALVAALNQLLDHDRARPIPVAAAGDPIADYLALFDRLVARNR